jgi:phosphopantetheinyl transferase
MVGNDIVDLEDRDADATTYSAGFDSRVFSEEERWSLRDSVTPERQRWRLWAAKEASYKLARQRQPSTVFSPIGFRVRFDDESEGLLRGQVQHRGECYRVEVSEGPQWVHAIAIPDDEDFGKVMHSIERKRSASGNDPGRDSSEAVRDLACASIARHLSLPSDALRVERVDRIPEIWHETRRLPLGLSLSHHGDFVAFACTNQEGSSTSGVAS